MADWKRTERREIPPFDEAADALAGCALRLRPEDAVNTAKESFLLEDDQMNERLRPLLTLPIDRQRVTDNCGIPASAARLECIARDASSRYFRPVAGWQLNSVPSEYTGAEIAPEDFSADGLDVVLAVVLAENLPAAGTRARRRGSILSSRVFTIRRARTRTVFQVKPIDFRAKAWPEAALWYVEFHETEDFDLPPERIATVWVNKLNPRFVALLETTSGPSARESRGLRYLVAAEVYAEIARRALIAPLPQPRDDSETREPGLRSMVVTALTRGSGISEEMLVAHAKQDPSRFRMVVQSAFGVGREYRGRAGGAS